MATIKKYYEAATYFGGSGDAIPTQPSAGKEAEGEETIHELKTWSKYFDEVFMGRKTFEVRKNDRDFKVGDIITLIEGDLWGDYPEGNRWFPTGRKLSRRITAILHGGQFGIEEGYCVMAIQQPPHHP